MSIKKRVELLGVLVFTVEQTAKRNTRAQSSTTSANHQWKKNPEADDIFRLTLYSGGRTKRVSLCSPLIRLFCRLQEFRVLSLLAAGNK